MKLDVQLLWRVLYGRSQLPPLMRARPLPACSESAVFNKLDTERNHDTRVEKHDMTDLSGGKLRPPTVPSALNVNYISDLVRHQGSLSVEALLDLEQAYAGSVTSTAAMTPIEGAESIAHLLGPQHVFRLKDALTSDAYDSIFGSADAQATPLEQSRVAAYLSQVIVQAVNALGSVHHADNWLARSHPSLGYQAPIHMATQRFGFRLVSRILDAIPDSPVSPARASARFSQ